MKMKTSSKPTGVAKALLRAIKKKRKSRSRETWLGQVGPQDFMDEYELPEPILHNLKRTNNWSKHRWVEK